MYCESCKKNVENSSTGFCPHCNKKLTNIKENNQEDYELFLNIINCIDELKRNKLILGKYKIAQILVGASEVKIPRLNVMIFPYYGKCSQYSTNEILFKIHRMINSGYLLVHNDDQYPIIKLAEKSQKYINNKIISPVNSDELSVKTLSIYTDGASRGNPGLAAFSVLFIDDDHKNCYVHSEVIGVFTNNQTELFGIKHALNKAIDYLPCKLIIFTDSLNCCGWLNGTYKVKSDNILPIYEEIQKLKLNFNDVKFMHVPRSDKNIQICDSMCNTSLDFYEQKNK